MLLTKSGISIYNPRNEDPKELRDNFVIRNKEYENIIDDIKSSEMKYPEQSYIIQGQRGYGKTTLLLRLYYEILEDNVLNKKIYPIIFTEEQYNIRTLAKLWEHIADYLEEDESFSGINDDLKSLNKQDEYEAKCFNILENYLKNKDKKIILFIDNIGDLFNRFSKKENQRLREVLLTSPEIRIIGGSAEILEQTYDYSKQFFDFFKIITLKGLDKKETESLLLKLSEKFGQDEKIYIENIIEEHPGRIESLRRLTGGVPRTIVLLFEVFIDNKEGSSFEDLEMVLDRVTPLYKHRMDDLSSNQQSIVDAIAMNWDAVNTKFIAEETGMESKIVSAQLRELEKNKIIHKIETSKKNHLYQLLERFFNIWYLMRYGRKKDKCKVQWLVQFLEIWCDKDELTKRAKKHLQLIKEGKVSEKYALHMTEAYIRTKLGLDLQDELIKSTKELLGIKSNNLLKELSVSDKDLIFKATNYLKNEDFRNALIQLKKVIDKNEVILSLIKNLSDILNDYNVSNAIHIIAFLYDLYNINNDAPEIVEKYYLMAAEKGNSDAMLSLARLYESYKDYNLAEKYYLMSVDKENNQSMFYLGMLYQLKFKRYDLAEKYYLMSINNGNNRVLEYLVALYYENSFNKRNALKYARQAFKKNLTTRNLIYVFIILLWNNMINEAIQEFEIFLADKDFINEKYVSYDIKAISEFILLLIVKKQYNYVYKTFEKNEYNLKDRLKPIYYVLLYFMGNKYSDEYKKMGEELKLTVEEIIEKINQMTIDYA